MCLYLTKCLDKRAGDAMRQPEREVIIAELVEALQDVVGLSSHPSYSQEQAINTLRIIKAESRAAITGAKG